MELVVPQTSRQEPGPIDESVCGRPEPALRPYIAWYSGYRQAGVPPMRHRGLPSPYLTLILTLDDPLTILAHPNANQPPGDYRLLLGGLHTSPALIGHSGRQSGIQIALSPLGASLLLGLPAGELAYIDLHADDVLGPHCVEVQERLRAAADWHGRFAVLDDWLRRRAAASPASPMAPELIHAWRLLVRSGGTTPIADLATEVDWSARHLSGRFAAEFGLTPKASARVVRFDRTRRRLAELARRGPVDQSSPEADEPALTTSNGRRGLQFGLAGLAVDCGYYDQAHMDREFRALTGCPPIRWLAEEFRNIQAGAHRGE